MSTRARHPPRAMPPTYICNEPRHRSPSPQTVVLGAQGDVGSSATAQTRPSLHAGPTMPHVPPTPAVPAQIVYLPSRKAMPVHKRPSPQQGGPTAAHAPPRVSVGGRCLGVKAKEGRVGGGVCGRPRHGVRRDLGRLVVGAGRPRRRRRRYGVADAGGQRGAGGRHWLFGRRRRGRRLGGAGPSGFWEAPAPASWAAPGWDFSWAVAAPRVSWVALAPPASSWAPPSSPAFSWAAAVAAQAARPLPRDPSRTASATAAPRWQPPPPARPQRGTLRQRRRR